MAQNKANQLYRIGEIVKLVNVNSSTLRFWETVFKDLKPIKGSRGVRFYTEKDINTIKTIDELLHQKKLTIEGAKIELQNMKNNNNPENNLKNLNKEAILAELKSILAILK